MIKNERRKEKGERRKKEANCGEGCGEVEMFVLKASYVLK